MSALAQFLAEQGHEILGSDANESEITKSLQKKGIKVFIPQKKENITADIDEVVYTSAITPQSPGNAELKKAKILGIKTTKRAQKIGGLTKKYKTIVISGTHGKSTTTAMVLQILLEAGYDPSALLGSNFDLIKGNYRVGKDKFLVMESDEFDRSFLNFYVDFGAILNIEADHLDYFKKGLLEIKETFIKYIEDNFKPNSFLVYNADDKNLKDVLSKISRPDIKIKTFGESGDYRISEIKNLLIPGKHNRQNAAAALAIAQKIKIKKEIALRALKKFKGAERRFDFRGVKNNVKVIDDYAHHPTEVKATLQAAREKFKKNRIIAVFQPHQYSRTKFFAPQFAKSFNDADIVIIPPIFEVIGRDEKKEIDNYMLVSLIKKNNKEAYAARSFAATVKMLNKKARSGDIIMVMGAGTVTEISAKFLNSK